MSSGLTDAQKVIAMLNGDVQSRRAPSGAPLAVLCVDAGARVESKGPNGYTRYSFPDGSAIEEGQAVSGGSGSPVMATTRASESITLTFPSDSGRPRLEVEKHPNGDLTIRMVDVGWSSETCQEARALLYQAQASVPANTIHSTEWHRRFDSLLDRVGGSDA